MRLNSFDVFRYSMSILNDPDGPFYFLVMSIGQQFPKYSSIVFSFSNFFFPMAIYLYDSDDDSDIFIFRNQWVDYIRSKPQKGEEILVKCFRE